MASVNLAMLLGHLSSDVVTRYSRTGERLATFSIATNTAYFDDQGKKHDIATFHNIVATGHLEQYAKKNLKKGMRAYVEGRIHTRMWKDKRTNEDRKATHVIADKLYEMPKPSANYYWEDDKEYRSAPGAYSTTPDDAPSSAPASAAPATNEYARVKG